MKENLRCGLVMLFLILLYGDLVGYAQEPPNCGPRPPAAAKLPDLMNIVPHHIHVQEARQRHRLVFTTGLANVGAGPLELVPNVSLEPPITLVSATQYVYDSETNSGSSRVCRKSLTDAFVFHPEHRHWHLVGVNEFSIYRALDNGSAGAWTTSGSLGSLKESFCLLDYVKMNADQLSSFGIALPLREYFNCYGIHGISRGWVDYYHHSTHGQFIDITGAPAGIYYFVLEANPDGIFLERNYTNNRSWVSFRLRYVNNNNAVVELLFDSFSQLGEGLEPPSGTNR